MKVVDLADQVYRELNSPSDTSIPVISYFLTNNLGKLNSAINKNYYVNPTTLEIEHVDPNDSSKTEELGIDEAAILKLIYFIHYQDLIIRRNNINFDTRQAIRITSDGHTVQLSNPSEIGKGLYAYRKELGEELKLWVNWYRIAKSCARQVAGSDYIEDYETVRPQYRTYWT